MAIDIRDFSMVGQFAKNALSVVPPNPISGQAYRNPNIAKKQVESGQAYDNVGSSAFWNQVMFLATGITQSSEIFGFIPWSPLTNYIGGASWCLGPDGFPYYAIQSSGPGDEITPGIGGKMPPDSAYWKTLIDYVKDGIGNNGGFKGRIATFTASGSWTVPDDVFQATLYLTGAGASGAVGGGEREAAGGSAGGTCIKSVDLTPGMMVNFTIGVGGPGVATRLTHGRDGGASACSTFGMTASGGKGGYVGNVAGAMGQLGGKSTGGDLNLQGGSGGNGQDVVIAPETASVGGRGGSSYWGEGGIGSVCGGQLLVVPSLVASDLNGTNPGSGGGGMGQPDVTFTNYNPPRNSPSGTGADGILVIYY